MKQKIKDKYRKSFEPHLNIDVEEFLLNKGYEFIHRGDWLSMRCPFPEHDDSNPSFFIHKYHLGFNCFVCGSGTWDDFVERMGWDVDESYTDINVNKLPEGLWKDFKKRTEKTNKKEPKYQMPYGFKIITKRCKRHYEYILNRNMDKIDIEKFIDTFNVGCTNLFDDRIRCDGEYLYGGVYKNRIIIPCHNEIGKITWFEGRYMGNKKISNKYWRPSGVNKTNYLFNFHRVKKKGYRWIVVVEGIIDAMILWMWSVPAVCSFGSKISEKQIGLLMEFDKVYICLDNDDAGVKGWVSAMNTLKETGLEVMRILLPRKKDINDLTYNEFVKKYDRAKYYG